MLLVEEREPEDVELECPKCGTDIVVAYTTFEVDGPPFQGTDFKPIWLQTWCFHPLSEQQLRDMLLDWSQSQFEAQMERRWERT